MFKIKPLEKTNLVLLLFRSLEYDLLFFYLGLKKISVLFVSKDLQSEKKSSMILSTYTVVRPAL